MKRFLALALVGVTAWFGYGWFYPTITYPPGILLAAEPEQWEVAGTAAPIGHGQFRLQPLAHFSVEARVLRRKKYTGDRGAGLSPLDLALGWGEMSNQAVLERLKISQSNRFYFYQWSDRPPISPELIKRRSANMHIIPADDATKAACLKLRAGELVRLEGLLVEASGPEMSVWRSSLTRDDSGKGACEVFYVRSVTKLQPDAVRAGGPSLVSR